MEREIYIVQDRDCDGLFSSVLAYKFLHKIDPTCFPTILIHSKRETGLAPEIMAQIKPNSFVWVPDAGSNDVEQCRMLKEQGCDILITDHHDIEYNNPYAIVINNQFPGIDNPCGSGTLVTYKFIQYVCEQLGVNWYQEWIDIVAFANIADIMELNTIENRVFNYAGLSHIKNEFLQYLCDNFISNGEITPTAIIWNVIPKLNAVIRGDNTTLTIYLTYALLGLEEDKDAIIFSELKDYLKKAHKEQSSLTKQMADFSMQSIDNFNDNAIICFTEQTPYTGLVANKISSTLNKPVFLVYDDGEGHYKGSCRSPIDVRDLCVKSGLFTYASGHQRAYGICFPYDNLNEIKNYFNGLNLADSQSEEVVGSYAPKAIPTPLFDMAEDYKDLWGKGVPEPTVHCKVKCKGTDWIAMRGNTVKLFQDGVTFIKFFVSNDNKADWKVGENVDLDIDIIGKPCYNEYNDNKYKQVVIEKIEVIERQRNNVAFDDLF
jgi:single-stranded-DNA-specific exonuclease